jgi:hypothetical protein
VEVIENKVVVSSFSPELVCFDLHTGEDCGSFDATQEIKSNPVWLPPFLLVSLHDPEEDAGKLAYLKKSVDVALSSSKKSPHKPNEEITFRAKGTGFHLPKYEFFLTRFDMARFYSGILLPIPQGDKELVQESSELNTWAWFPEEEGYFNVGVVIVDEKEKAQAQLPLLIRKQDVRLALSSSEESPQQVGQNIVFTAGFSGLETPRFEFRLSRLNRVSVMANFPILFWEDEKIVQETSAVKSWTWTPGKQGLYLIRAIMQDGQESRIAAVAFIIRKE